MIGVVAAREGTEHEVAKIVENYLQTQQSSDSDQSSW